MTRLLLAALLGSAIVVGCRRDTGRADARAIVRAYESFQGASATDRAAALRALESAQCDDALACADRDACSKYGKHLLRAQQLVQKARELGPEDAGGNGAATESELAIIVAGADDASREASAAEPPCRAALERLYTRARR
ncbi:MAG: hypothetical protein HYV09_31065 [Deltaproteobacteria bacterium]|nr:hypothetical protein [Deltaproteobacteria bacterium]